VSSSGARRILASKPAAAGAARGLQPSSGRTGTGVADAEQRR
jgi:hypothetical protein